VSPADPVAPTTDDALQIRISGDASSAGLDPTVIILVDGVKKGTFAVTADHADGEWQTIAIDGTWKAGVNHKVEVKFNEKASSQAVYVDSVTLNGDVNGTNATMLTSGNKLYWVGDDAL
jgi:Ca-dependent carbohydrate-binding module xylan-binding